MDFASCKQWGILVRPGETVKCDPGGLYCHISQIALQDDKGNEAVRVFVKVSGNEILIGTLSADRFPQCTIGLVFEKEFELLHTSKTSNISALGYKFRERESYSDTSTDEDDDSDEEVPLAIPLYPDADDDDKSNETKSGVEEPASTQFCKPKNTLEETKDPEKLKADAGGTDNDDSDENSIHSEEGESDDDEDSCDEDDSSDEDDGEDSLKNTMGKNRPAETPLKTPLKKKAKIATPSMGNKTGSASTKKSGYIHVATPYPSSKQVKKTPSIIDCAKQPTGYSCKSCRKTFHSSVALDTHCKVKHNAHSWSGC